MSMSVRDASTWKTVNDLLVRDGGVWKSVQEAWVRDGGIWKKFLDSISASLSTRTVGATTLSPASAICHYRISTDGNVYGGASTSTFLETWRDSGSNPDFEVRATSVSGTIPTGTFGSWMDISTNRTWSLGQSGVGYNQAVIDIEIRNASTLAVLTTARITMFAEVNNPF